MSKVLSISTVIDTHTFNIKSIDYSAPFIWLSKGMDDVTTVPFKSILYGLFFVIIGDVILALTYQNPVIAFAFISGFVLVAPFLALGLYQLSQNIEEGEKPSFSSMFRAFCCNGLSVALYGAFLMVVMITWLRISSLLMAFYAFNTHQMHLDIFAQQFFTYQGLFFFGALMLTGAVLAFLVYLVSAIAFPFLLDHKSDPISAAILSTRAVLFNLGPMLLWAFIIVLLIALSTILLYIPLIFILPLLAYSSWHAYKDIVSE